LFRLAGIIRRGKYDIVHTHNWSSMFYGVLGGALARRPLIVHGEHGLNRADLDGVPWKRLWAQRALARAADWIVPVNDVIAAHVRAAWRLDGSRMTVIPNGVDLTRFAPSPPVEGREFVLGMVGRLDDVKDIGCALEAMRLLKEGGQGEPLRLLLVGDGPARAELEVRARESGLADCVEFAGARSDVETYYRRIHLFLNTSVYEGMCNTLLEAMACGLPLVASRVPGNSAWLKEEENALFFSPGNASELAGRIAALRADVGTRAAMGSRNHLRARSDFDNRGFIDAYVRLYARLLAGRKPVAAT
jgi:glycosyltransferase involved in cell wall biosynthesis